MNTTTEVMPGFLLDLPPEVLLGIIKYLVSLCNRSLRSLTHTAEVWRALLLTRWPHVDWDTRATMLAAQLPKKATKDLRRSHQHVTGHVPVPGLAAREVSLWQLLWAQQLQNTGSLAPAAIYRARLLRAYRAAVIQEQFSPVTVTILGSKGVGKTAMILSQIQDEFIAPEQYDSFLAPRTADGTLVFKKNYFVTKNSWVITMLEPDVTGVVKEMTRVKPAIRSCLARSDAVILAFNVADEQSIDDVTTLWGPQLREVYGPHVPPVILLGLQTDLRGTHMTFTAKQGKALAKQLGASNYKEMSAMTDPCHIMASVVKCVLTVSSARSTKLADEQKFVF